jgi:hypothetical protein
VGGIVVHTGQSAFSRKDVYVTPKLKTFDPGGITKLAGVLQKMDRDTTVSHLTDSSELQFDFDAKTVRGGFRFTAAAFSQIAQLVAPGLSKFLPDIAGTTVLSDIKAPLVDAVEAIKLWNHVVDLRFPLFQRYRVIRNIQDGTIEGLVGHKHHYLENLSLYREACESLSIHRPEVQPYAAILVGRRLAVWFRSPAPMFNLDIREKKWSFHHGYYFTNGEATGTAVRGTLTIFSPAGTCLAPFQKYGDKVCHTGKSFNQRLGQMFAKIAETEIPLELIQTGASHMLTKSLGFKSDWDKNQRAARMRKLIHAVMALGVPNAQAKEIAERTMSEGRNRGQDTPISQRTHILYASRTLLDLYVPLLWAARQTEIGRREKIEQAAFDVLVGRFLI